MSGAGVVTFNYATWTARYPELAPAVTQASAGLYFAEACLYLDNTAFSVVQDTGQRTILLNMLVAHIGALALRDATQVGRIADASQGSVHVAFADVTAAPGTGGWFAQTQYGAAYWQTTAQWRTMRYTAPWQPFGVPSPAPTIPVAPAGG